MSVDPLTYNKLITAIKKDDVDMFINVIYDNDVDMSYVNKFMKLSVKASRVVNEEEDFLAKLKGLSEDTPDDVMLEFSCYADDTAKRTLKSTNEMGFYDAESFEIMSSMLKVKTVEDLTQINYKLQFDHIRRLFYCWENPLIFGDEEQYCINKINNDSSRTNFKLYLEEYKKFKDSQSDDIDGYVYRYVYDEDQPSPVEVIEEFKAESKQIFKLPTDFFKRESVNLENTYIKSYANFNPAIRMGGVERFEEFIDYLALNCYIDNSREAKESFVFKFTGRKVSESTNTDNHKIKWGRRLDDLVYLVQNILLIANPKDKYESLNEHFVFEDNKPMPKAASNLAANANKGFVAGVKNIYPEVKKK